MNVSIFARVRRQTGTCLSLLALFAATSSLGAAQVNTPGPVGSTSVGDSLQILPEGNIVLADVGAVTWGDGSTDFRGDVLPSNSVVGTSQSDRVGF